MTAEKGIKERTKVVLRHIPPGFTSESLLLLLESNLNPFPEHDFFHFAPADYSLVPYLFCRAYFNFTDPESAFSFKDKFNGQKFEDCNKIISAGIVEYAPFQRIPKRFKKDIRSGTIDKDPDYLEFLKELEIEPEAPPSIETIINEIEKQRAARIEQQSSTALLEYIKHRRSERSLSPNSKPQYPRRDRYTAKADDNDGRKFKNDRRAHVKTSSETDQVEANSEEIRSRNNVKAERNSKPVESKVKPDKAIYVPGKKKSEDSAKQILTSQEISNSESENDIKNRSKDERHSYRRDKLDSDKKGKDQNHEPDHDHGKGEQEPKGDCDSGYRRDREYRRNDNSEQDRRGRDRYNRDDDRGDYRRDGYDSRTRRDKEFRRDGYDDRRDKDYDRDGDFYEKRGGRGSYRGGFNSRGSGWREDRRGGRGSRGRGRGTSRGDRSDR